jgi:flagellar motor switch protein FliN/FliY
MTTPDNITELLSQGMRSAAEVAQAKTGRAVTLVAGADPNSTALLRFDVQFVGGATLSWYVSNEDATGFSDILIGGGGDRNAVLTEMHLDALSGVFSDMLEASVVGISSGLTAPLEAGGVDMGMETGLPPLAEGGGHASYALDIEGFGPLAIASYASPELVSLMIATSDNEATTAAQSAGGGMPENGSDAPVGSPLGPEGQASHPAFSDNVVPLPIGQAGPVGGQSDLRKLLNVPLQVTVELGRAQRTVRDLLELNVGSILELDKLAGDPMDIMVNGRVLAKGEVVVIDEEFGIRITEIVSPDQRARGLGG